jgi:Xaa-Pro aminopeptidase
VNIDSVEFPDDRLLLDGSCFSLEPGIYFERFGMRTEIDVYIKDGQPVISGKKRQFELLCCP